MLHVEGRRGTEEMRRATIRKTEQRREQGELRAAAEVAGRKQGCWQEGGNQMSTASQEEKQQE